MNNNINEILEDLSPDKECLVHNYIISLLNDNLTKEQEINRLNNIINELEKYLTDNIEYVSDEEYGLQLTEKDDYFNRILDKLKELKEEGR